MERIAKIIAKSGYCSRRDAEKLILDGFVVVNGEKILSPALNVGEDDEILIKGKKISLQGFKERVFIYYKPVGLVTTHKDNFERPTVFENLPKNLPRLISVGRLDLNSEGLLILTTSGEFARKMELPSTGLKRVYRARVLGTIDEEKFNQIKNGVEIDGVKYGKVLVEVERSGKSANNWVRVTICEGKNREVRKILSSIGLKVNRLIRMSYGPYNLGNLKPNEIKEVEVVSL